MSGRSQFRAAVVLLLGALLGGCQSPVVHELVESEANQIVAVLQQHGVIASKELANAENNTWNVMVPKQAQQRSWAVLEEYKLPKQRERRFRDVFGQSKLVVTPMEEKALYLEALQGELAETIESIDGVIDSRVHLVLREKDLTGKTSVPAKASVVVEYQPDTQGTPPIQAVEVAQVVAAGVDGLDPGAVVVILKPASIASPATGGGSFDLVSYAGLNIERGSVARFKAYAVSSLLVLLALGGIFFLQGRKLSSQQTELARTQMEMRRIRRASGPPQAIE